MSHFRRIPPSCMHLPRMVANFETRFVNAMLDHKKHPQGISVAEIAPSALFHHERSIIEEQKKEAPVKFREALKAEALAMARRNSKERN